ncbi:MAG: PepSY-associated TM helix domain-containing protein [Opitutaceae bacterium]
MFVNKTILHLCRTVHVYLTMLGLLVMLLFSITGFTVNHAEWFGATTPRVTEREGTVPLALIAKRDELRIVESLREAFRIRAAMTNFSDQDDEYYVSFKSPGELWEISVVKATGKVRARQEAYNFTAIVNNLHRGRFSGPAWSWVIDLSAALIVLACLTGFVLWLALPRRRQFGIVFLVAGTLATMAVIYFFVPGPDAAISPSGTSTVTRER